MTSSGSFWVVAVAALGVGCAGARSAQTARPPPATQAQAQTEQGSSGGTGMDTDHRGMHQRMMMHCPMDVPGTQVAAEDTTDGEAITFTTTAPDQVPDLRARIHAMADMYERHHASGQAMHDGTSEGGESGTGSAGSGSPDAQQTPPPSPAPSRAVVEDVEGGARVTVTPNDPADVEHLRSAIRARVAHMQETGTCAMGHVDRGQGQQDPDQDQDQVPQPQDQGDRHQ